MTLYDLNWRDLLNSYNASFSKWIAIYFSKEVNYNFEEVTQKNI